MKKDWFKKRYYTHFSPPVNSPRSISKIRAMVADKDFVGTYSFYPLINKNITERKYKKLSTGLRSHKIVEDGTIKSTAKERKIFYANHVDAHIYSYYAKVVLGDIFERKLKGNKELSDCICAYRTLYEENSQEGKCNIHFAHDVFNYIEGQDACCVLAFDITAFFDSLDHRRLKKAWKDLLEVEELPKDHYNIYKSLTQFKYVKLNDILREFGVKSERVLRNRKTKVTHYFDAKDFREKIVYKKLIEPSPFSSRGEKKGIPQGTAISAFLANLYMVDFDALVLDHLSSNPVALYRRYSDDIIVVCSIENKDRVKEFVEAEILKFGLEIQPQKTEVFLFERGEDGIGKIHAVDSSGIRRRSPLKYLGFEFDGEIISIKAGSLSKFYRKLKKRIKSRYGWARKGRNNERKAGIKKGRLWRKKIYRQFTHLGGGNKSLNYYTYSKKAKRIIGDKVAKTQLRNNWKIVNKVIDKHERKLNKKVNRKRK